MATSRRTSSSQGSGQPRQLPGSACEECRKRKLRCDRQRPQCGTCADAGIVCEVNNNRLARGPKKGDLKALRSRIVALERRLSIDHGEDGLTIVTGDAGTPIATDAPVTATTTAPTSESSASPSLASPCQTQPPWDGDMRVQAPPVTPTTSIPLGFSTFKFPPTPPSPPRSMFVDDLMRADLDQLYFDRVHPNIPIFNHSRYFARSRQTACPDGPSHMLCLQYAMWTLAMALSSQFESSREPLYHETRQMLEALDMAEDDMQPVRIEQVQAWLLVAYYEFARSSFRRASISAGRAFRLVQLARLHEVDSPENSVEGEDPVLTEEKRRTFWVAYCLDRLICLRNRCPLTLAEEAICTRLPSPELAFQGGHPIQGSHLAEVMASGDHNLLSPLAETAIITTVCGRALSHCQVSSVERALGGAPLDFWIRHDWLDSMLTRTLDALAMSTPVVSAMADPMLLFAFIMGHAATIYMCQVAETSPMPMDGQCRPGPADYRSRATRAAREIAGLTKAHEHLGYFKAHIFLPLAISMGASQLTAERQRRLSLNADHAAGGGFEQSQGLETESEPAVAEEIQSCMEALRKIQSFNNLARDNLAVLESQEMQLAMYNQ